jgi:hypothetical protein
MPDAQATSQTSGTTPAQQTPTPCKDTTPEPTHPPEPEPKPPCPKPKPCAEWPKPPCPPPKPDPCADDDDDCEPPEETPPPAKGDCCEMPAADDPSKQLATMQTLLQQEQKQAEQLQRVTTSIADLTQRIQALQQMIDGEAELVTGYKDFYRTTEYTRSQMECLITTVGCDINLSDGETRCIDGVIAVVDARVAQAKGDYDTQKERVDRYQRKWERAKWKLDNAQLLYDFFGTGLKAQIQAKLDLLGQLKGLADPTKGRCEAAVYLRQMESLLHTTYGTEGACFPPAAPSIGTFLDCWSSDCYVDGYNRAVVELNNAAWAEKCRKTLLDAATARLAELDLAAKDAESKRWDAILASVKAEECCKSGGKC